MLEDVGFENVQAEDQTMQQQLLCTLRIYQFCDL
ncbi:hypothetical protein CY35_19G095000 [Sphagnum magellanicum]|nr:hypothetical protein CY35_19G095000 [Sphagnum magellanicum]